MARLVLFLLLLIAAVLPAKADGPWSGQWQVTWRNGGAILTLDQQGAAITGSYSNGRGKILATARDKTLEGQIDYDGVTEGLSATLGPDQISFSGQTEGGDWLSGVRLTSDAGTPLVNVDLRTPRAAMRSFLSAANLSEVTASHALALAVDTIDFGKAPDWASRESAVYRGRRAVPAGRSGHIQPLGHP